jgi:hypothetical protein
MACISAFELSSDILLSCCNEEIVLHAWSQPRVGGGLRLVWGVAQQVGPQCLQKFGSGRLTVDIVDLRRMHPHMAASGTLDFECNRVRPE